jgi:hypothetical protein
VIVQYIWLPRGLDGVRILDSAPGTSLLPSSETDFVSYNLATRTLLRAGFNADAGARVTGLTLACLFRRG